MITPKRKQELENLFQSFPVGGERKPYFAFVDKRLKEDPVGGAEETIYLIELGYQRKNLFFTSLYADLLNPYCEDETLDPYFKEGKNKEKSIELLKWVAEENGPVFALEPLLDAYWNDSSNYRTFLKTASKWIKLYVERVGPKEASVDILEWDEDAKRLGYLPKEN
jgi:hypothetical protein